MPEEIDLTEEEDAALDIAVDKRVQEEDPEEDE